MNEKTLNLEKTTFELLLIYDSDRFHLYDPGEIEVSVEITIYSQNEKV